MLLRVADVTAAFRHVLLLLNSKRGPLRNGKTNRNRENEANSAIKNTGGVPARACRIVATLRYQSLVTLLQSPYGAYTPAIAHNTHARTLQTPAHIFRPITRQTNRSRCGLLHSPRSEQSLPLSPTINPAKWAQRHFALVHFSLQHVVIEGRNKFPKI